MFSFIFKSGAGEQCTPPFLRRRGTVRSLCPQPQRIAVACPTCASPRRMSASHLHTPTPIPCAQVSTLRRPFLCPPASMSPTRTPHRTTPALPPTAHTPSAPRLCEQERTRSARASSRCTCSRRRSTTSWRRGRRARFLDEMVEQMAVQCLDKLIFRPSTLSDGGGGGGEGRVGEVSL